MFLFADNGSLPFSLSVCVVVSGSCPCGLRFASLERVDLRSRRSRSLQTSTDREAAMYCFDTQDDLRVSEF